MSKRLPKEIYVVWDTPSGTEDAYLLAAPTKREHAQMDVKKIVGTYRLVVEEELVGAAVVKPLRKTRR
jgi:hypothetical protein